MSASTIYTNKTNKFIQRVIKIHGDTYDYSKVKYVKVMDKVEIICSTHGVFEQRPNNHLNGQGCPSCAGKEKRDTKSFIEESIKVHGDTYEYSLAEYKNSKTKVEIICPEHGVFKQKPDHHILRKQGCPQCHITFQGNTKSFIEKVSIIHNNKYDYSKVNYTNNKTKVEIICPEHGSFWQIPASHQCQGCGCEKCSSESHGGVTVRSDDRNANEICTLYNIKLTGNGEEFFKIGISKEHSVRHNTISRNSGYEVEVIDVLIDTRYNCNRLEKKLLNKRQRINKYVPNKKFAGWSECYTIL